MFEDRTQIVEMFKLAFGEEEYQKIVEAAVSEMAAEMLEKAANPFEDEPKSDLYQNVPSTISQRNPTNKEIVNDTWNAVKGAVSVGAKGVKQNIQEDVEQKVTNVGKAVNETVDKAQAGASGALKSLADKIAPEEPKKTFPQPSPDADKNYGQAANPPYKEPKITRNYGTEVSPPPKSNKEIFEDKMEKVIKSTKDAIPSGEEISDKAYEIAGKALDAATANPGAAATVLGGTGIAGLAGLGLLGKGVAKAIRKNKIPKEVVASINEEILEELIKES